MDRAQYFAHFVSDVAITMSDISQNYTGPQNCLSFGVCGVQISYAMLICQISCLLFMARQG